MRGFRVDPKFVAIGNAVTFDFRLTLRLLATTLNSRFLQNNRVCGNGFI